MRCSDWQQQYILTSHSASRLLERTPKWPPYTTVTRLACPPQNTFDGRDPNRVYAQNCPANALTARKACVVNALLGSTEWNFAQVGLLAYVLRILRVSLLSSLRDPLTNPTPLDSPPYTQYTHNAQANPPTPNARDLYNLGVYGGGFTDVVCSLDCASNGKGNPGITEWCVPARSRTYALGCCC